MKIFAAISTVLVVSIFPLVHANEVEKACKVVSERLQKLDCISASHELKEFLVDNREWFSGGPQYLSLTKAEKNAFLNVVKISEQILEDCQQKYGKDKSHGNFIKALANLSTVSDFIELHEKNRVKRAPPEYVVNSYDEIIGSLK